MNYSSEFKKSIKSYLPIIFIIIITILIVFILMNLKYIFIFLNKLLNVSTPIIIGGVMAYIVTPLYRNVYLLFYNKILKSKSNNNNLSDEKLELKKNQKKFISRLVAIFAAISVWVILLLGLIFFVLPELISSVNIFISNSNNYQIAIKDYLNNIPFIPNKEQVIDLFENFITNTYSIIINNIFPNLNNILQNIYVGFYSTFVVVMNFMIGLIIMVYILFKQDYIVLQIKKLLFALIPEKSTSWVIKEIKYVNQVFTNFFSGKVLDSIIIFILSYIIFIIAKIPYALLLSLVVGITNIVPFFGPIVGAFFGIIFVLLVAPEKLLLFVIIVFLIQQFDGNILGPKILSGKTGVDSFYVLCSTIVFGGLFGFVGMILAVPIWAILYRMIDQLLIVMLEKKKLPTKSREFKNL